MEKSQENREFDFRVLWGFVIKRYDREHPNLDGSFNSIAVVQSATVHLNDELPGILLRASHPEEGSLFGNVSIDTRERAKELAEFVSARKGKTVENIAAEIRTLGLF
jgi:hypothetical protein